MSLFLVLIVFHNFTFAQSDITGKWKSFDDETPEIKSIVEVFKKDGKYYGRIVKLFRKSTEDPDPVCTECDAEDPRFNKKIIGGDIERHEKDW